MTPSLTSSGILIRVANTATDDGQNPAARTPSFFATAKDHAMFTSAINQLTPSRPGALAAPILPMSFSSSAGMTFENESVSRPRSVRPSPSPRPSGMDTVSIPPRLLSLVARAPRMSP
jgi:hypothetical protein